MKNKIVLWGTNAQEEKVLIALELLPDDNKVMLYTFPESIAVETFVNDMMDKWRSGKEPVPFPEGYNQEERELSVVESLLPDDLRPERTDVILRAQTEWQFVVLSSKLYKMYEQELQEFRERVQQLGSYDNELFVSLKAFWEKVQEQSRDRNILREQAEHLRENIDGLFNDLKNLRKKANDEFNSASKGVFEELSETLAAIEQKLEAKGVKFNLIFDELKKLQRKYREARMSNEHRNRLWDRIDNAFKAAKERKFGPSVNEGSVVERHGKRLEGLSDAVQRMANSIKRDEEDLKFEQRKIERTEGQLEAQIRGAKIKMIEERIASKREKLNEIIRTQEQVEKQIRITEEKEKQRAEKEAERLRLAEAKEKAKAEIAKEIKTKKAADDNPVPEVTPGIADTPDASTEAEVTQAPKSDSLLEAIGNVIGEVIDDTIATTKAVAGVVAEAAEEAVEKIVDQVELVAQAIENVEAREKEAVEAETTPKSEPETVVESAAAADEVTNQPVVTETADKPVEKKPKKAKKEEKDS
ncbi:MAG: hypothetical protein SFV52_10240 [Saprospiraceae bacterium]|nr:hypothetical protein [Saprospiraceae bacterium]